MRLTNGIAASCFLIAASAANSWAEAPWTAATEKAHFTGYAEFSVGGQIEFTPAATFDNKDGCFTAGRAQIANSAGSPTNGDLNPDYYDCVRSDGKTWRLNASAKDFVLLNP